MKRQKRNNVGRRAGPRWGGREAQVERRTRETQVSVRISIDGKGEAEVDTGVPFLDHMLELMARHGLLDIAVSARGDLAVDAHHTVEDVGIALGEALGRALGDKAGLVRFGQATIPLDEALVSTVVDLSGRPYLAYRVAVRQTRVGNFDVGLVEDFLRALVNNARITLHVNMLSGRDPHHVAETIFKGLGRALDAATRPDPRVRGVPSTKGTL